MSAKKSAVTEKVTYDRSRLFLLSVASLATCGIVFSTRAATLDNMRERFFVPVFGQDAGAAANGSLGLIFIGLCITMFLGSPLCDYIGMGRLLKLAALLHIGGTLATIFAASLGHSPAINCWIVSAGSLTVGLAHGLVEAVINPLTASVYPDDKIKKLNHLHAWWPGGIVIGGLIAFGMASMKMGWQSQLSVALIPAVIYGVISFGTLFPPTERVASGVPAKEMWKQAVRPAFLLMFCCMFLTASSELSPDQWVKAALSNIVGFNAILILVYVSVLMFTMRHFAGPLVHKLSPIGLLWLSCLLAAIGLFMLGVANSPITAFIAATLWGTGVCYMWPTMIGVTNERFPKGGALLMGLMGSAGMGANYFTLWKMGGILDQYKIQKAQSFGFADFNALSEAAKANVAGASQKLMEATNYGNSISFKYVAVLPIVLLFVFGGIWLWDKSKGGYKAIKITHED
ncbi:MAG: MFS transporter [bacterium]